MDKEQLQLYIKLQQTTHKVISDILGGSFHFNTAISALMELTNGLYLFVEGNDALEGQDDASVALFREAFERLVLLLAPMAPHLCEEIWERMGRHGTIFAQRLPEPDRRYLETDTFMLVVQINGKVRSRIEASTSASREEITSLALADEKVKRHIAQSEDYRVIVVPGKLVNIVTP